MDTKEEDNNEIKDKELIFEESHSENTQKKEEETLNKEEDIPKTDTQTEEKKKDNFIKKAFNFLKKNILAIIMFFLLIIVIIWMTSKNSNQEKQFIQEKTELVSSYESRIDSIKVDYIVFATEVFSWSVRSELLRNNVENLNQLVSVFVKKSNTNLVQIIDIEDKKIILSSDKKYEDEPYTGNIDNINSETIVRKENGETQIITPIIGFNSKIGILMVTL